MDGALGMGKGWCFTEDAEGGLGFGGIGWDGRGFGNG